MKDEVIWNPETEIHLFNGLEKCKPVGLHKHIKMIGVYRYLKSQHDYKLKMSDLWQHFASMYNLNRLDRLNEIINVEDSEEEDHRVSIEEEVWTEIREEFELPNKELKQMAYCRYTEHSSSPGTLVSGISSPNVSNTTEENFILPSQPTTPTSSTRSSRRTRNSTQLSTSPTHFFFNQSELRDDQGSHDRGASDTPTSDRVTRITRATVGGTTLTHPLNSMHGMPGAVGKEQHANEDIKKLVQEIRTQAEDKANRKFINFEPITYASQVVAGINYFVKVKIDENEYIHLRIYQDLQHNLKLHSIQNKRQLSDPILFFS